MNGFTIRVLLVDDDEDDYFLTRELLAKSEGQRFELHWAATYEAGLQEMQRGAHDVYLVDYRLGERNGVELVGEACAGGCGAAFVLLTGQGDRDLDVEAMRVGVVDYLTKGQLTAPLLERAMSGRGADTDYEL